MSSYDARAKQHDTDALNVVVAVFRSEGFSNFTYGTESDSKALREALRQQHDRTSIMLRYRPDQMLIKPGARTVLCEVKSESVGYPNFCVEADAYLAGQEWNAVYRHVMYAFCDLKNGTHWACWADEVPCPNEIVVPTWHHQYTESMHRLPDAFPGVPLRPRNWGGGSGTPHFFVPKPRPGATSPLTPLDLFVRHEVWDATNGWQAGDAAAGG